ncbi:MAG: LysM peptidoglycan-binding domain-containing protein [Phycisphaerales bacterium JB047]
MSLLVLVWIGVYWMWQPTKDQQPPKITFEQPQRSESKPTLIEQPPDDNPPTIIDQLTIARTEPSEEKPAPGPELIPPEFIEHIVRDNETMQSIAKEYFGSGENWRTIARANPFVDPQKLKAGMSIRIPKDPNNIQGIVTGKDAEPGVIESHTDTQAAVIEYVVRPGDSLSRISQRIYGSSRHARFIFDSNRDKLKSMDDISIGQLLRLPPLPENSSADP